MPSKTGRGVGHTVPIFVIGIHPLSNYRESVWVSSGWDIRAWLLPVLLMRSDYRSMPIRRGRSINCLLMYTRHRSMSCFPSATSLAFIVRLQKKRTTWSMQTA